MALSQKDLIASVPTGLLIGGAWRGSADGATLPLPTRVVIFLSENLIRFMPVFIVVFVAGGWGFRTYYATEKGRRVIDQISLKMPILGPILRKIAVARFCRTLA